MYLTVQSLRAREKRICSWRTGDSVLLALCDRILSIPSSAGRSAASPHCHSVLSVGGTAVSKTLATLCYGLITKFSTAVQCGSTLVRYTNSDTCVTGSAATGTRVSGVLCTEHGGVSCCPPIYVSVTGMLGPVAAHRYMSVSLECSAQLRRVSVHRTNDCRCELQEAPKLVSECRLHVLSGDGSFQIRFWRVLSQSVRLPAWHIPCEDAAWATTGYVPCLFQFVIG